jgi:hypothetical protein
MSKSTSTAGLSTVGGSDLMQAERLSGLFHEHAGRQWCVVGEWVEYCSGTTDRAVFEIIDSLYEGGSTRQSLGAPTTRRVTLVPTVLTVPMN